MPDPVPSQPQSGSFRVPKSSPEARSPAAPSPSPVRITPNLFQLAAQRLVSQSNPDIAAAGARLVDSAEAFGIDLGLIHATVDTLNGRARVRQACLPVLGSGRTAMIFVSEPAASPGVGGGAELGGEAGARAERAACVRATCDYLAKEKAQDVLVAQGLPEAGERWTAEALRDAGFTTVGTLSYMRRAIGDRTGGPAGPTVWPEGVEVVALSKLDPSLWDATLVSALDRTYVDTLDCPELCGMRTTPDILASHRATGEFDPSLWWVFLVRGEAHGCLLLTRCPEQRSLELVYLGLSPLLRGKGLSGAALWMGIQAARADCVGWNVACAVDQRNAPALKVYGRLGFRTFSERTAMVRVVGMPTKQA